MFIVTLTTNRTDETMNCFHKIARRWIKSNSSSHISSYHPIWTIMLRSLQPSQVYLTVNGACNNWIWRHEFNKSKIYYYRLETVLPLATEYFIIVNGKFHALIVTCANCDSIALHHINNR